jgi:hypothetical protein
MIKISDYISGTLDEISSLNPWDVSNQSDTIVSTLLQRLTSQYALKDGVAVHNTATIEVGAV